jgi:tRNA(His) guanylyltransferase
MDDLGDRMKSYERVETARKFDVMLPVYARIDGRGFSKFTKGMDRPFDRRMTDAMIETTRHLVDVTHANIGYVQSDEISLVWQSPAPESSIFFDGKIQKMTSVLAGIATAAFNKAIRGWEPFEDRFPHFDARVLQLPSQTEAANMFLWRVIDARKNAVSMATRAYYSAKEMHGKDQAAMLAMLAAKGVNFDDFDVAFRRGTFLRRVLRERSMPENERNFLLAKGYPVPETVIRSAVEDAHMPAFWDVANRTEVIFTDAAPQMIERDAA